MKQPKQSIAAIRCAPGDKDELTEMFYLIRDLPKSKRKKLMLTIKKFNE